MTGWCLIPFGFFFAAEPDSKKFFSETLRPGAPGSSDLESVSGQQTPENHYVAGLALNLHVTNSTFFRSSGGFEAG